MRYLRSLNKSVVHDQNKSEYHQDRLPYKHYIHEALEGGRSIGETKKHDRLFEWSVTDIDGLLFITFNNTN